MHNVLAFAFSVSATPQTGPIDKPLQQLLNTLVATGLILSAIGFVFGGAMSAVGGHGGNYGLATRGRSMMGWAAAGAALIAGATAIINWFWGLGLLI
jgi:hypothetical protein